jgi:hypothetical protein
MNSIKILLILLVPIASSCGQSTKKPTPETTTQIIVIQTKDSNENCIEQNCKTKMENVIDMEESMINITNIFDQKQFEDIVQYVLNKGEIWEYYSSLWGHSPVLNINNFCIVLHPNPPYFDREYQEKMRSDVSHYRGMTIQHYWEGACATVKIQENVYILFQ